MRSSQKVNPRVLLAILFGVIAGGFAYYTYSFYLSCEGTVVRGAFAPYECIE